MKHVPLLLATILVVLSLNACAMFGGKASSAVGDGEKAAAVSQEKLREELEAQVAEYLSRTGGQSEADARLERFEPYYFRAYNVYPQSVSDLIIEMTATESRTAPYLADVRLACQRIATPMHRNKEAAREDSNFLRETGTQILTYEYRSGRWLRTGSLFLVDRTEQRTAAGWEPVPGKPARIAEGAEGGNWFTRTWSGLVGR